jgi:DNA-binding MarR family transcriptional regulator
MKNLTQSEKLFMLFQRSAASLGRVRMGGHRGGEFPQDESRASESRPERRGGLGQIYVLSLLSEAPQSQKELLEKLGTRAGSLSELLGKLENSGYITRTKDENDNRVVNVAITEAGREFAKAHGHRRTEIAEELFAVLDEDEQATLIALLEKLQAAWKSERDSDDRERRGGHGARRDFDGRRGDMRGGYGGRGGFGDMRGFGGFPGFGPPPDFGGFERGHDSEHEHGHEHDRSEHSHEHGHHHGEEITDPELKAYLDEKTCGECDKNCKLSAPHCGKGAKKQKEAIAEYKKD